jgi:tRNA pseudouridine55 synthase
VSVLVIDKPPGPTSFDVVRRVRRALGRVKIGHGGTLDPMASGVLPVCIGEGTKLAPFLLEADKEYEATVRFGVETDTLDATGQVLATRPTEGLAAAAIEAALVRLRGDIEQVPPMYSALKRQGRPLYSYARAGETVERAPRQVRVHELVLESFEPPDRARLRVRCSKGTYVRTLAADLGRDLGTGAHLVALRRIASGPFRLAQALTPEALEAALAAGEAPPMVSLADALAHLPAVIVDAPLARAVGEGRRLLWTDLGEGAPAGRSRLLRPDGTLLAVVEPRSDGRMRCLRVFGLTTQDFYRRLMTKKKKDRE